jgi:pilus assembly protein FimV
VKTVSEPRTTTVFTPDLGPEPTMQRTESYPVGGRGSESAPRDVSIEELIDLEQQAEFFMVLGQEEAAVDLLVEHLRSTGGGSPLPYLKLLEIHHRRGDHEAYERMRQRFNHRFNAYAPEWGVDLTSGRSLEDYAGVVPRLQQVWPRPLDAMAELEALLFRKSRGELFDLPAYREVLFLYALARDLLDRAAVDTGSVDLLLPMNDAQAGGSSGLAPTLGLDRDAFKDTMPPEDLPNPSLDFDLTGSDRRTSIFDLLDDKPQPPRRP